MAKPRHGPSSAYWSEGDGVDSFYTGVALTPQFQNVSSIAYAAFPRNSNNQIRLAIVPQFVPFVHSNNLLAILDKGKWLMPYRLSGDTPPGDVLQPSVFPHK